MDDSDGGGGGGGGGGIVACLASLNRGAVAKYRRQRSTV